MNISEKELAERLTYSEVGSAKHTEIMSEIQRRQLFLQYEAVEATKRAALAEEKAAEAHAIAVKSSNACGTHASMVSACSPARAGLADGIAC
jgi:hypothetical protein